MSLKSNVHANERWKFSQLKVNTKSRPFQKALQRHEVVKAMEGVTYTTQGTNAVESLVIKTNMAEANVVQLEEVDTVHTVKTVLPIVENVNFTLTFPEIIPENQLLHVHPWVNALFSGESPKRVPLAGRLKHFLKAWQILTKDPKVLSIVKGYEIPFMAVPHQKKTPHSTQTSSCQAELINKEILEMLGKGAIQKTNHSQGEFLSNIFLVQKKDGGQRPVINLKNLNKYVPYQHFKMEGLHCLKYLLQQGDWMCKIDLKDAYFTIPLSEKSQKYIRFRWEGTLYEFLCLCFGLGPAPRIFTKLLKIPISLLRRINIRLVIFLDDVLLMAQTIEELLMSRDTLIFLFQKLGFVINLKKSVFQPTQQIEYLGLIINSQTMTLSLTQEKINKVISMCQNLLTNLSTTILELTKIKGVLSSTVQTVLLARLQF